MELTSPAFSNGEPIPAKYSRNSDNISPPLSWDAPPEGTQSMALICDDLDAPSGTWVHWVIYNLPSDVRSLPEAVTSDANLADGSSNGKNSWGELGYDGPSPPSGTHRYYFKIYALDTILDLEPGASNNDLIEAMDTHVLADGELMGTYSK
ncbi:MAG: YbhB/YbcL family Raf kinase inhibitor-like protein [Chloroflexi bacterium]|nr:YbhB/YbcL family Raf kinase inhibitor-like protein [Chloroflexota bacterium]